MGKATSNDGRALERLLSKLNRSVCDLSENSILLQSILDAIGDLTTIVANTPQKEIEVIKFCEDGVISGYTIKIYDEVTGSFTEIYWDDKAQESLSPPVGIPCPEPIDYEYKIRGNLCKQDSNGNIYHVDYCDIFTNGVLNGTVEFWYYPDGTTNNTPPIGEPLTPCTENPFEELIGECTNVAQAPPDTIIDFNNVTVQSSSGVIITNNGSEIRYNASINTNTAIFDLGEIDLSIYSEPSINIVWRDENSTTNFSNTVTLIDGTTSLGITNFTQTSGRTWTMAIPNTATDLKLLFDFNTGWLTDIILEDIYIQETGEPIINKGLRVISCEKPISSHIVCDSVGKEYLLTYDSNEIVYIDIESGNIIDTTMVETPTKANCCNCEMATPQGLLTYWGS